MDDAGSTPKHEDLERAKFHAMTEGTQEDWMKIGKALGMFSAELPNRTLTHLKMLQGDCGGFAVDRLEQPVNRRDIDVADTFRGWCIQAGLLDGCDNVGDSVAVHVGFDFLHWIPPSVVTVRRRSRRFSSHS